MYAVDGRTGRVRIVYRTANTAAEGVRGGSRRSLHEGVCTAHGASGADCEKSLDDGPAGSR